MQAPHWRVAAKSARAQVWQRWQGWANAFTHASHTGRDGHAWQTAQRLGRRWVSPCISRRNTGPIYSVRHIRCVAWPLFYFFMSHSLPPTIAPQAAARWAQLAPMATSPWLHEEVASRMAERLQWIKLQPRSWIHWEPLRGGLQVHKRLLEHYPGSLSHLVQGVEKHASLVRQTVLPSWWSPSRWTGPRQLFGLPAEPAQMVWSNMGLHMAADPQGLIGQWCGLLEPNGFLMFSCLGPDTLRELRTVYAQQGWQQPSHAFTDMHDWGDMLLQAGFAEPVMDMEHITLTFETPERLLLELRELGRNLHVDRFGGLRGRQWRSQLLGALEKLAQPGGGGTLHLTFEVVYGHAFKAQTSAGKGNEATISLDEMRATLRKVNKNGATG